MQKTLPRLSCGIWLTSVMFTEICNTNTTKTTRLSRSHVIKREKLIDLSTLLSAESLALKIKARNELLSEL